MMCQYRFINCSKCVTLLGKVNHEGGCGCVGAGVWEISEPSTHYCYETKTALKQSGKINSN